jgi:hypothetical protein
MSLPPLPFASLASPPKHRLMRQRTIIKRRRRPSDPPTPSNRRMPRTKHTNIHGWYIPAPESTTAHMQPLIAALTLNHRLPVVDTIAHAPSAFARQAAPVRRRRGIRCVGRRSGKRIITVSVVVLSRHRGMYHVGRGLGPALVVCLERVLRGAF